MPSMNCSVHNCFKTGGSKLRFLGPIKTKLLFNKRVHLCGNKRLISESTPQKIYANYRVCSHHFLPEDFDQNGRMKKGVLPSVNLLASLNPVDEPLKASFVEIEHDYASTSKDSHDITTAKFDTEVNLADERQEEMIVIASTSKQICSVPNPETPKKRSALLHEVHVSKVKDLTPKAKHLYERAIQFKRRAIKSQKSRLSLKQRLIQAEKFTTSQAFETVVSSMDSIRARFFESQVKNINKKPKARRYTLEDKVLALALYTQSGAGYRFLSKLFALPSRKTAMQLLNRIHIYPGLHHEVLNVLKAEAKNFKNPLDQHCILMFDEISIHPNLHFNLKRGIVEGFEDFGSRRSEQIANHAQVFMLRGIRRKWKQPIYYNFVSGATKKADLHDVLTLIIRKCHNIGLNIVATVCDQGANNQVAINMLVKNTQEKHKREGNEMYDFHFEVDGKKIIPLFDVLHLFKGIRNNLLKYNLSYFADGKSKLGNGQIFL